jgi:hypothetical protein
MGGPDGRIAFPSHPAWWQLSRMPGAGCSRTPAPFGLVEATLYPRRPGEQVDSRQLSAPLPFERCQLRLRIGAHGVLEVDRLLSGLLDRTAPRGELLSNIVRKVEWRVDRDGVR